MHKLAYFSTSKRSELQAFAVARKRDPSRQRFASSGKKRKKKKKKEETRRRYNVSSNACEFEGNIIIGIFVSLDGCRISKERKEEKAHGNFISAITFQYR